MYLEALGLEPYMNFLELPIKNRNKFKLNPESENKNLTCIENFMGAVILEDGEECDKYAIFFKRLDKNWSCFMLSPDGKGYTILDISGIPIFTFPQIVSQFGKTFIAALKETSPNEWQILE